MNVQPNSSRPFAIRRTALPLMLAFVCASAAVAAAGPSPWANHEIDSYPPVPGKGDAPVIEAETVELATLHVSNGNVISLMAAPKLGELGYAEIVPAAGQSVLPDDQLSALEIFLALTPADTPVPRALVDLSTDENVARLAAHRARTDRHEAPIEVALDSLDLGWESFQRNNDLCGAFGSQTFTVLHCQTPIDPDNRLAPISFCDADYNGGNTVWFDLNRGSYQNGWRQRERSYGRTASCGANVTIRQQVWFEGAWLNLSTHVSGPGGFIVSKWSGGLYFRRITRERTSNVGGFRAYTDFYIFLP